MSNRVQLSSVTQINPRLPKGVDETQEVSFLSMASVSEKGKILRQETRKLGETKKGYTYFERNDVLLAKITPCFENGKAALASDLEHPIGFGSTEFHVLRPDPKKLDAKFLFYLVWSRRFRYLGQKAMTGAAGQRRVPTDFLNNFEIPLPPLDVQKRIAHLLGKVEGLIARRKHHLQQLDDLLKSVFLKMFGDPVRNEKKHNISTLAPYITHLTSGGRGWATYYSDSGKRFIRSLDVQMNAIGSDDVVYVTPPNNKETERTRVIPGDVLLTITGSKIGRVCFVPQGFEEAYISQHVAIIRTKGINPVYLSFYLSMPACGQRIIAKQQYGQAKPGLNLTQIQNFEIIDPDLDLQNQFAAIVEKVESLKSRYQHSMADLETLYGALSQKAFKGELDLSRVVLPVETSTNATGFTTVVPPQKSQQHQHTKAEATP